jgi:aldehyde dehydrogenase (NAD+)
VVIDPNCDLKMTARRLIWGKVANAGQVHVLVTSPLMGTYIAFRPALPRIMPWSQRKSWISWSKNAKKCRRSSCLICLSYFPFGRLKEFYPDGAESSDSYARIVSPSHFSRIKSLLDRTEGKIVYGGSTNADTKFIEPTIVTGVKGHDSLMGE